MSVHRGRDGWGRESRTSDGEDLHHPAEVPQQNACTSDVGCQRGMAFSQRGLFSHFGILTDVNILQKLREALGQRGQTILHFCQKLDNPKIREFLASYDPEGSEKAACILQLLMVYFKEPTEKLMLEVF